MISKEGNIGFKKYVGRALIFSIPFLVYFLFIFIIDPHNFFNVSHIINDKDKYDLINRNDESSPRGNLLWKVLKIKRDPPKIILIGDSQGKNINPALIEELTGEKVFNFCVPGASYETMFDMFWFAASQSRLEKVYFPVAFLNYNSYRSYNLFHFATDYIDRPYLYLMSVDIFRDSWQNFLYKVTRNPEIIQDSYEYRTIDEMNQLTKERLDRFFIEYYYPKAYFSELNRISQYCKENNIALKFIIFPNYKGFDEYLEEKNLSEMMLRFKDEIKILGDTYDLDIPGDIKNSRECFVDYFHLRKPYLDQVTRQIWTNEDFIKD